jgi:hypothetical protein
MTAISVIVWTCVGLFISTGVITLLALVGVLKLGGGGEADHRYYLKALFSALVLEIIANGIAVFYQETRTPQLSDLPNQIVAIQRRINSLEQQQHQAPAGPHWVLHGVGSDCSGQDFGRTSGTAVPDPANCQNENVTAVCWDGNLFRNGTGSWCTYKRIPPDQCVGGSAPGRLYSCVGS